MSLVLEHMNEDAIFGITLNDPKKRNALGLDMFEDLCDAIQHVQDETRCVLLRGEGKVFCAGFDMKACANDIGVLESYIKKLSQLIRALRRLHCPVVAAAHGAAIAGGCALLTGCDFAVGEKDGKYGYPVHQLGVSPAVTIPTLFQRLGEGMARSLLMGGALIGGEEASQIALLTHVTQSCDEVHTTADALAKTLASKPPLALRATKRWLNELDGSNLDDSFDQTANDAYATSEADELLKSLWKE